MTLLTSVYGHLVDSQLRSTSESVFDASQDAVHVMLVALKQNHRIYDVLQNLWSGKCSLLINMSYQNNRNALQIQIKIRVLLLAAISLKLTTISFICSIYYFLQ